MPHEDLASPYKDESLCGLDMNGFASNHNESVFRKGGSKKASNTSKKVKQRRKRQNQHQSSQNSHHQDSVVQPVGDSSSYYPPNILGIKSSAQDQGVFPPNLNYILNNNPNFRPFNPKHSVFNPHSVLEGSHYTHQGSHAPTNHFPHRKIVPTTLGSNN